MVKKNFLIILGFTLFLGNCTKTYNKDQCEDLSMKAYKGWPQAAHKLRKYCKNVEIHYTSQRCQKALVELTMGASLGQLKKKFGSQIGNCFNQEDLNQIKQK